MSDNNKIWSEDETMALLDIWGGKEMQEKMGITKRNRLLWEDISKLMISRGFIRSYKQCGGKIHNMKVEYRKIKLHKKQNNFKYYDVMDTIMTKNPTAYDDDGVGNGLKRESDDYDNESLDFFVDDDRESLSETNDIEQSARLAGHIDHTQESYAGLAGIIQQVQEPSAGKTNQTPVPSAGLSVITKQTSESFPILAGRIDQSTSNQTIEKNDDSQFGSAPSTSNEAKKRPRIDTDHNSSDSLSFMFDKFRDIQKESDERFYAWEEKRLRIEREFEERRQQRELERENRRDEYFLKFAMALIGQHHKSADTSNVTCSSTSNDCDARNHVMNMFNKNA